MDPVPNKLQLAKEAHEAGMPYEQIKDLTARGYVPLPWQLDFHALARQCDQTGGPVEVGAGGARGPGKSHAIFAQVALDDCQRIPGLKVLFLRKTSISAKESFQDLIDKVILGRVSFKRNNNIITFPNRSRILLGGFHNENDIDKYVGIEYDVIVVEELNQLTEEKIEKLLGSLRTSKPSWRPRLYASFNPGGIGHTMVKSRFVIPHRQMEESRTRFVPATYKENPNLNREYIEYLESVKGDLGRAWREGDFDLFAGQYFKEWRYDIHVCDPFTIPDDWRRFMAGDYGHSKPASIGWYAIDPNGTLYRYRELYGPGRSYSALAREAHSLMLPNEKIEYQVWDPALWAKKGERDDELNGAQVYAAAWKEASGKEPAMYRGENARVVGWGVVREYLAPIPGPHEGQITSKLQVFSTCTDFIRTIPELQHDEVKVEDLDTDGEDHAADELRYAVMSEPRPSTTAAQREDKNFKRAVAKKHGRMGITPPRYKRRGVR